MKQLTMFDTPAAARPEVLPTGAVKGCSIIYAPSGQAGEYAKLATNPYRGCGHRCLSDDTSVFLPGHYLKRLKDIQVGDEVLGVIPDRWNGHRYLSTTVKVRHRTRKMAWRITLVDGTELTCSGDHRWLTTQGWKYTAEADDPSDSRPHLAVGDEVQGIRGVVQVHAIEQTGDIMEMFDITTGTETFVANGMISHNCSYCYVPLVLKMKRPEFDAGAVPRPDYLKKLRRDAKKYEAAGITERVLLSFTTDPYCPDDVEHQLTRAAIQILQEHGLAVVTLTKGGARALRDIDLLRPGVDAFATTLTHLDPDVSRKWEAGAALPAERMDVLRQFHERGIFTWVSLEPVYDTEMTLELIRQTHTFVDLYKVGRINYHKLTKTIDWQQFTDDVLAVLTEFDCGYYIKHDLQPHLPAGQPHWKGEQ